MGYMTENKEELEEVFRGNVALRNRIENIEKNIRELRWKVFPEPPVQYSTSEPKVRNRDKIGSTLVDGKILDEFFITEIIDGEIWGKYMDGRNNFDVEKWEGDYSVIRF